MKKLILPAVFAVMFTGACGALFPFAVDNLGDTRLRALCHFAFSCCTPVERSLFANAPFKDEGTCVSEASQDGVGGLFAIDQEAKDAVDRKKATYDADKAEKCSRDSLDAINQCKSDKLFSGTSPDFDRVLLLVDSKDPVCVALAARDFTTGTVKDGDDCLSSFDCADFGSCVKADGNTDITTKGSCKALHKEGADCSDGVQCQPGLACTVPAAGGTPTCATPKPKAEGEDCNGNNDCASGNCAITFDNGLCFDAGTPCTSDADCDATDFCDGAQSEKCGPAITVKIEVCNGQ